MDLPHRAASHDDDAATPDAIAPDADSPTPLADFRPVPVAPRHHGWTAERQRNFLRILAETGSVSDACLLTGVTARSAYRLRQRPDAGAFALAWEQALRLAASRLTAVAVERAVKGTVREIWRHGELVGEVREPNDRLLMFLIQRLVPPPNATSDWHNVRVQNRAAHHHFPDTLAQLTDSDAELTALTPRDFRRVPPVSGGSDH